MNEESGQKEQPRFFCDAMLGRLGRELRLLGLDVEYRRGIGGMRVYREARAHDRVLLTRNKRLAQLPGAFFVNALTAPEQVAEVREKFGSGAGEAARQSAPAAPEERAPAVKGPRGPVTRPPEPPNAAARLEEKPFSRCTVCNEPLQKVTRDQARPSIPFFIYQIHHEFTRCPKCKRVYWPGSHAKGMEQRVQGGRGAPGERRATDNRRPAPGGGRPRRFGRGFRRRAPGPERRTGDAGNEPRPDGK